MRVSSRIDSPALLRQAPNTFNISPTYDRGRLSLRAGMAYNGANIFSYLFAACVNGEQVQPNGVCVPNSNDPVPDPTPLGIKGPLGDVYLYSHFQVDAQGSIYLGQGLTAIVSGLNLNNESSDSTRAVPGFRFSANTINRRIPSACGGSYDEKRNDSAVFVCVIEVVADFEWTPRPAQAVLLGGNHVVAKYFANWGLSASRAGVFNPINGGESIDTFSYAPTQPSRCPNDVLNG